MKRHVTKFIDTYKKNGFRSAVRKSYFVLRNSILRRLIFDNAENEAKWKGLKGKYSGKRVFIIGNGPSLNKTPLYLLKNDYKICFNRFNVMFERINWTPNFYMIDDELVLNDMVSEIQTIIPHSEILFFPDIHRSGVVFRSKIRQSPNLLWFYHTFGDFSTNLPWVGPGDTVVYTGAQVMFHLGFSEVIFIGVDMNYQIHESTKVIGTVEEIESLNDDDPNHFDPRYFGKGRKYHQPFGHIVRAMLDSLARVAIAGERSNVNVLNAGFDSKVPHFRKVPFAQLFSYDEQERRSLFIECIKRNSTYNDIDDLDRNAKTISAINENLDPSTLPTFKTDVETALRIISRLIPSHVPLGPFKGSYYFVRRQ